MASVPTVTMYVEKFGGEVVVNADMVAFWEADNARRREAASQSVEPVNTTLPAGYAERVESALSAAEPTPEAAPEKPKKKKGG